jgi:hypothetical protein
MDDAILKAIRRLPTAQLMSIVAGDTPNSTRRIAAQDELAARSITINAQNRFRRAHRFGSIIGYVGAGLLLSSQSRPRAAKLGSDGVTEMSIGTTGAISLPNTWTPT